MRIDRQPDSEEVISSHLIMWVASSKQRKASVLLGKHNIQGEIAH